MIVYVNKVVRIFYCIYRKFGGDYENIYTNYSSVKQDEVFDEIFDYRDFINRSAIYR